VKKPCGTAEENKDGPRNYNLGPERKGLRRFTRNQRGLKSGKGGRRLSCAKKQKGEMTIKKRKGEGKIRGG